MCDINIPWDSVEDFHGLAVYAAWVQRAGQRRWVNHSIFLYTIHERVTYVPPYVTQPIAYCYSIFSSYQTHPLDVSPNL